MKLKPEQISTHLKKEVLPVYLISGEVPLIIQETCDLIRTTATQLGFSERETLLNESGFDWQSLIDSGNMLSLFGDKKLIELRIPTSKPGDKGSKAICSYLEQPSPDNLLLIICGKLDAASQRSKWFKAIEKAGATIQVWPIEIRQLPSWVNARLKTKNISIDQDACQILAEKVEGNLLAAAQEIEKLALLFPDGGQLTSEEVLQAVTNNARYDLFSFIDQTLLGNRAKAIKMLRGLKEEGNETPIILWALTRELRLLTQISEDSNNMNMAACFKKHRVWDKRKPIISANLQKNKKSDYQQMFQLAAKIDQSIKGLSPDSAWDLLERLTLKLSK